MAPTKPEMVEPLPGQPTLETLLAPELSHHAKQLQRMLPGGLSILGLCVVQGGEIFTQKYEPTLKTLLQTLIRQLSKNAGYAGGGGEDKIIFHYDFRGRKFGARVFQGTNSKGSPPVVFGKTEFIKVQSIFDCGANLVGIEGLKEGFRDVVNQWRGTLSTARWIMDGGVPCEEVLLAAGDHEVSILVEKVPRGGGGGRKKDFVSHLHLQGIIHAVCFVEAGSSTLQAKKCLEEDILRSLTSRLEMHCESLIEEESGDLVTSSTRVYHELPRRVFVRLGASTPVLVSDYLFPGEGPKESINSFLEILNITVREADIDAAKEPPFDLEDLQHLKGSMEELLERAESISKIPTDLVVSNRRALAWIFSVAFLILLVSLALPIFQRKFE